MNWEELEGLPYGEVRWTITQCMIDLRRNAEGSDDPADTMTWPEMDALFGWPDSRDGKGAWNFVGRTIYHSAEGFRR